MKPSVLSLLRTSSGLDEYPLFRALVSSDLDVVNFDDRLYCWHEVPTKSHRLARRWNRRALATALDERLIYYLEKTRPTHFLIFKSPSLSRKVVLAAKSVGAKTVGIYPDLDPAVYGAEYVDALSEIDLFFHTKPNLSDYFRDSINKYSQAIGPFYDPALVAPIAQADPEIGVSFIGHHSPGKEQSIAEFASLYSGRVSIYGDRWSANMFRNAKADIVIHPALYGRAVNDVYQRSTCVLGLLMEAVGAHGTGDEITSRTILVPSYGGLLLHKKTPTAAAIFGDHDDLMYENAEDLAEKVKRLESDPNRRTNLASIQQALALLAGTDAQSFIKKTILS
ncbi:glycosyltransferase family protein [Donghicola tyrosinivorans]|uniref:Spore protein YkvP/CgeB glycosyl transferase-like domain-containing protein n=1 Tax=Donghicola tyrosinivorans TaxID=1652492 RepID=A0A2T0WDJ3_9RHOB|nr:glycosyltransferase [Donghicola tyrosinivorans]PRY84716.1 hypothetical protein CLV74_12148 [Donghicola tyrosinivorans]